MKRLISLCKRIYNHVPEKIRPIFFPFLFIFRKTRLAWLPVSLLNGLSRNNQQPLCIALVGYIPKHHSYLTGIIFISQPEPIYLGRLLYLRVVKLLKSRYPECSLIICEPNPFTKRHFRDKKHFTVPDWVRMEIDISRPMKAMEKESRSGYRNIARLIRRYQFILDSSQGSNELKYFYEKMYLPFAKHRFGETASLLSYEEVFNPHVKFELYFLKKQECVMAGVVVKFANNRATLSLFGVREEYFNLVNQGMLGATSYFIIKMLQAKGFKKLSVGDSRPFLNDGITRFKIRLLATLEKIEYFDYSRPAILIVLNGRSGIRDFLVNQPFIYISGEGHFSGAAWIDKIEDLDEERFARIIKRMERCGIENCSVYSFAPVNTPAFLNPGPNRMSISVNNVKNSFLN